MQNTAKADRLPRLLSEQPADKDRFGVHECITEQLQWIIEEITRNGGEAKKNVVALFGTWGSGKSTVINLLEKNVKNTYKVIRYDSWSHRDEHLKKAFLLHLLEELKLKGEKYEEEKEEEKKKNKEENTPTFEDIVAGKVTRQKIIREPNIHISLAAALVGGILVIGSINVAVLSILRLLGFAELPLLSKILLASSYALLLGVFLFARNKITDSLLSPFLKTPLSISEAITSFGNMEIPSIQFQKFFREILKEREKKEDNLPLIIVLDNLDRVDDETVSRFFSLIQSALDALKPEDKHNSENDNDTLQEQVVFIVPIDRTRVQQVLRKMIHVPEASQDSQGNGSFQEDFLKKLFPYAVEIPELIDYTWRVFFREKLDEAFPMIRDAYGEKDFIVGLFYHGVRQAKRTVTPREIIHFINELVLHAWIVHRIQSLSSETYQLEPKDVVLAALYTAIIRYDPELMQAFFKKEISEHGQTPKDRPLRTTILSSVGVMVPQNYRDLLLMLHYNTANILDMLIVDPILAIITSGGAESDRLIKDVRSTISRVQTKDRQKAIQEILSRVFDEQRSSLAKSFTKVGRFIWILRELDGYERFRDQLWAYLKQTARSPDEGKTLELVSASGIRHILSDRRLSEDERKQVASSLGQYFARVLDEIQSGEEATE